MRKLAVLVVLLCVCSIPRLYAEIRDCEPSQSFQLVDGTYTNLLGHPQKPVKSVTIQLTTAGDCWVWPVFDNAKTNRFFLTGKGTTITFKDDQVTQTPWKAAGSGGTPTIEVNRCYGR